MAASFVADLFTNPVTSVTNSTTITGSTNTAVAAGDTCFFFFSARGGTDVNQAVSISGLPGDAVIEGSGASFIGTLQTSRTGSPASACIRVHCPTGMSTAQSITGTWVQSNSRKVMDAVVWTGVANANAQATGVNNNTGSTPDCGTSGATTTTNGVHMACWGWNSAASTNSGTAGSDTEGTMTERTDQLVGASTFHYLYAEDRIVTAAHAGGETALVTVSGTLASWCGVQGIWAGSTPASLPPRRRAYSNVLARR